MPIRNRRLLGGVGGSDWRLLGQPNGAASQPTEGKTVDYRQMHRLQDVTASPAVTILAPTHRLPPDNEDDPKSVGRLVDAAERKMNRAGWGSVSKLVCATVRDTLADFDWNTTLDGLVIFAGMGGSPRPFVVVVRVPYRVKARATVGTEFSFEDLPVARHDIASHVAVHLTDTEAVVYSGEFSALTEIGSVPRTSRSQLAELLNATDGPIIVLSASGRRDIWADHIPTGRIIGAVAVGDVSRSSAAARYLGVRAWEVVADSIRSRRYRLLDTLGKARDNGRAVGGLSAAKAGLAGKKLRAVYVEETFHVSCGNIDEVDELIEAAKAARVPVHLFEHGTLSGWGHIVGIAR